MSAQLRFFIVALFNNLIDIRPGRRAAQANLDARIYRALFCFALIVATQINTATCVFAQTKPAQAQQAALPQGDSQVPSGAGQTTQNTVPSKYEDAVPNLYRVDQASQVNQSNINTGVNRIISGDQAPLVFQAAEQGQGGDLQKAANNVLNGNMGSINDTYRGMHQWFKDDLVGNLFSNIGQLAGKWLSELLDGWIADSAQFLAKFLRTFVLNPNIAVNGLNGSQNDGISPYIRQGADVMYGIAVDLLLLLFILCIWKFWADASWNGAGNLMGPIGRLIFTSGLLLAWPTIYAFEIQISNEMIKAIYFNNADQVMMLDYALAQAVKGGVIAAGAGATMVFAPILSNLGVANGGQFVGQLFYFASTMIFTILGGILITELVYIIILKAIQTALLTAQYMFAPIFLVLFATPDTESYATGYVRAFVETSLWTFVWVGLLKVLTIVLFSDFNPWGKILIAIGVLQIMIQVPSFIGRAQISPASDFITAGLVFGGITKAVTGLGTGLTTAVGNGVGWFTDGRNGASGTALTTTANMGDGLQNPEIKGLGRGALNESISRSKSALGATGCLDGPVLKSAYRARGEVPKSAGVHHQAATNKKLDSKIHGAHLGGAHLDVEGPIPKPGKHHSARSRDAKFHGAPQTRKHGVVQSSGISARVASGGQESGLAAARFDAKTDVFTGLQKFITSASSGEGTIIKVGQRKASAVGSAEKGVARLNIADGANGLEFSQAFLAASLANRVSSDDMAKDAARKAAMSSKSGQPHGVLENLAANWLSNTGSSWDKTALAKQKFQHAVFEQAVQGSQAYLSKQKGNAYTDYLRSNFGAWTDENDAAALQLLSNPQSNSPPSNSNVGPASDSLIATGMPLDNAIRSAMQNPALQVFGPSKKKQATKAILSYTHARALAAYGGQSDSVFKQAHGDMARNLPADEVENALVIYQLSGHDDLSSAMAPQYMAVTQGLSAATQKDFGAAYSSLVAAAPLAARRLRHLSASHDLSGINSYSDLAAVISVSDAQKPGTMQVILETAASDLAIMESYKVPMATVLNYSVPGHIYDILQRPAIDAALAVVSRSTNSTTAPISTGTGGNPARG